ncbi:hypothetical protein ACFWPH_34470 [Nocardia sp. NPDC058499]|uniref:hypothetical protein n=1 Tax=Nocardia sp. NPDC058499 TaxID=3346530 RepID=UPI00365623C6
MTTTTTTLITPIGYRGDDPSVAALREALYGTHLDIHRTAMDTILRLVDIPPEGDVTYAQESGIAPVLLPMMLEEVGLPARKIAQDVPLRGALCDSAAIAAPHLFTVMTGHFALTIGAILALGTGHAYQEQCLAELDTGESVGVFALTELGGTNGTNQKTIAVRDAAAGGYRLYSAGIEAVKAMPNLADEMIANIVVFTSRLIENDQDKGVPAFLARLRTVDGGLAEGVEIHTLPPKLGSAMPHALIKLDGLFVPDGALLCGDWGGFDENGDFVSEVPVHRRFHRTIEKLDHGRLDLGVGIIRSAGAGAAGTINFTGQRPHGDSDALHRDIVTATAATFACSVLGRMVREIAAGPQTRPPLLLWLMVVKPLLTTVAQDTLLICRERLAAHGILRCNYLPDWISDAANGKTAEGDTRALQVTAGRAAKTLCTLTLDGTPSELPWWLDMIVHREDLLATDLYLATGIEPKEYEPDGDAMGPDSARVDLAHTTGVRLAVTAALIAAESATDPAAAEVARSVAAVMALNFLAPLGTWHQRRGLQSQQRAEEIETDLLYHRRVVAENLTALAAAFDTPELPGAPVFAPDYLQSWEERTGWGTVSFVQPR